MSKDLMPGYLPVQMERKRQKDRKQKQSIGMTSLQVMPRDHLGDWIQHPWIDGGAVRLCLEGSAVVIEERTAHGTRRCLAKLFSDRTVRRNTPLELVEVP